MEVTSPEIFRTGAEGTYLDALRAWCGSLSDRTPPHPVVLRPQDVLVRLRLLRALRFVWWWQQLSP